MPAKPTKVLTQTDRRIIRIAAATKMSREQIRRIFDGVNALMSKHMGKKVKGEFVGPGLLVFNEALNPQKAPSLAPNKRRRLRRSSFTGSPTHAP